MDLVNKESKGIDFLTVNSGYKLKNNIECGLSFKSGKNSSFMTSISYNGNINKDKTEYLFSTSIKSIQTLSLMRKVPFFSISLISFAVNCARAAVINFMFFP